ncbi:MAG: putative selenate reductase subunit YgfK [Candidatus Bipolaricaulota bacterium]|nr:putative selenate reductase subunit YgfK [Candidatus Bipolaricaulota bacterium]
MSDKLRVQSFSELLGSILQEYEHNESIFGIHRSLFYVPKKDSPYATEMFGSHLATPVGPAAGPHTQLARNTISSWLSGGRFMELKTVQIMDELEISRPCIDVADEGYNVEWSQELKLEDSVNEYVNAWVAIHILRRVLGFDGEVPFGTIFNMSVGYNLEGIKKPRMVKFMDTMIDASEKIAAIRNTLADKWPEYANIEIPARLTNSVTLSTMHGCPPDEIEQIARYLIEERGLNTLVKLNPTLLGKDQVLHILHKELGYEEIRIPDSVFDNDLQYERAVRMIEKLKDTANANGLFFGIKLANTLPTANHRNFLSGEEMYMSGRALYPITMTLFDKLMLQFGGDLNVSYAGGADALNVVDILSSGACPVTCASELLKPGGYSHLLQFVENIEDAMNEQGAMSLANLSSDKLDYLKNTAAAARDDLRYKKAYHSHGLPKLSSDLSMFDCITAPCSATCPVEQDVPDYAWLIAHGEYDKALSVILARNPLPGITGYICTHVCQTKCTRNNYDESVAIRNLKRFAVENGHASIAPLGKTDQKVAVIGSGPSGLSAASFLALNGINVTIFEAKDAVGGMPAIAPKFRLPQQIIDEDVKRIVDLGVRIETNHPVDTPPESLLDQGFSAVYVASGFQRDAMLEIDGFDGEGTFTALDILERVRQGEKVVLGEKVVVIGGGNTAMDAARTAARISGVPTTIIYRRTKAEMPADIEEIEDLLAEGNTIEELLSPVRVIRKDGKMVGIRCVRNRLGEPGPDGRRRPVPIKGSEIDIPADTMIIAIGQRPELTFLDGSGISVTDRGRIAAEDGTGDTGVACVYAGGDATRGPATIIQGAADGRRAAKAICLKLEIDYKQLQVQHPRLSEEEIIEIKRARARKVPQVHPAVLPLSDRSGFDLVEKKFTEEEARAEASRCLQCSTVCDKCVEVCPNRANYTYHITPFAAQLPVLSCDNGNLQVVGEEEFAIKQDRQVLHVDDFCNKCGVCAMFCVHTGKPAHDKPRLFLDEKDFQQEDENAFYVHGNEIRSRHAGSEARLIINGENAQYEDEHVVITLSPRLAIESMRLKKAFDGELSLTHVATMSVILRGIRESLPFLVK